MTQRRGAWAMVSRLKGGALAGGIAAVVAVTIAILAMGRDGDGAAPPIAANGAAADAGLGRIAYVHEGDLWMRDLPAGQPRQLTHSGDALAPRWSASGEWLLFGERVIRADGTGLRPAVGCVEWSPVADDLACSRPGEGVVIESADGSRVRALGVDPAAGALAWSPDGARLAYAVALTRGTTVPYFRSASLHVIGADGRGNRKVVDTADLFPGQGGEILYGIWVDGSQLLFTPNPTLSASVAAGGLRPYLVHLDSGAVRPIDAVLLRRDFAAVEPDRGSLAIVAGGGRESWSGKRVALVDTATGAVTPLTPELEAALWPAWAPDGQQLAYVSAPDIGNVGGGERARSGMMERHLWLMAPDGTGRRQLTNAPAYRDEKPEWSADGSRILFARLDAEGVTASLWLIDPATGATENVAEISPGPGPNEPPLWFGFYGSVNWNAYFAWWRGPGVPHS